MKKTLFLNRLFRLMPLMTLSLASNSAWADLKTTEISGTTYYEIGTADELYEFADIVNGTNGATQNTGANAILTADIVVNSNVLKPDGTLNGDGSNFKSWTPMGTSTKYYKGTFDGKGHTISGLYCNNSATSYVGFFGSIVSGKIYSIGILDSYFSGIYNVGGVCGYSYNGTISNCYNSGSVNGGVDNNYKHVGGVCGWKTFGTISNCYNTGRVTVIANNNLTYVGGVCGYSYNGTISNCYNSGSVNGSVSGDVSGSVSGDVNIGVSSVVSSTENYVGGVCGSGNNCTISNCYNTGCLAGPSHVDGICGEKENVNISNCTDYSNNGSNHDFSGSYTTVTPATCTNAGTEFTTCQRAGCTATNVRKIAALGHDFSGTYTTITPATCTETGTESTTCQREGCTATNEREIAALGHDFTGSYTTVTPATCTETGTESTTCQREGCTATNEREIAALGHDFTGSYTTITPATCTETGSESTTCQHEGCTATNEREIAAIGHDFSEKELTAEPDEAGLYSYVCKNDPSHLSDDKVIVNYNGSSNLELKYDDSEDAEQPFYTDELTLTDGESFYSPVPFVAKKLEYSRIANKDTMSIIFPCDVPADMVNGKVYELVDFDGEVLNYRKANDGLVGNTPYLIYKNRGENRSDKLISTLTDVVVYPTSELMEIPEDASSKAVNFGSYNKDVYTSDAETVYYAYKNGKFWRVNNQLTMAPFRSAIRYDRSGSASIANGNYAPKTSPSSLSINFTEDDACGDMLKESTEVFDGKVNVYDVLGRAVRLNVEAAQCLDGLKDDFYIVNGKKVRVINGIK